MAGTDGWNDFLEEWEWGTSSSLCVMAWLLLCCVVSLLKGAAHETLLVDADIDTDVVFKQRDSIASVFSSRHAAAASAQGFATTETIPALDMRVDVRRLGRADAQLVHELTFAVQQKNLDDVERRLHEVSDPFHAAYGQHLPRAAVGALTRNADALAATKRYLASHGVDVVSETVWGEYVVARASVGVWEDMLGAEFHHFEVDMDDEKGVVEVVRSLRYTLPADLHGHVTAVHNACSMPMRRRRVHVSSSPAAANKTTSTLPYTDIHVLNRIYDIRSNRVVSGVASPSASQGVYEALNQSYSPADLLQFQRLFGLPEQPVANDVGGHVLYGNCTFDSCGEANLDVQYMLAVAQDAPTTYYYTDDSFSTWLVHVANMTAPPQVLSISYGGPEVYNTASEKAAFNVEAMKLGLMGVTLFASSGDDGVANFIVRTSPGLCGYFSDFPGGSPYVTTVGATQGAESGRPEVVCQSNAAGVITSGGGFSDFYPRPAWQNAAIEGYFRTVSNTAAAPVPGYNTGGRGYPDVSAAGLHYHVIIAGESYHVSGTSASSPVVAAMITLVNAARLRAGKGPVGWLNPALYAFWRNFTMDVVHGDNKCGANNIVCCQHGFNAAPGWDAATGLGTLNHTSLMRVLVGLGGLTTSGAGAGAGTARPASPTPAPSPSAAPTAYPTTRPGYAYITHYADTACKGDVERVEGYATGVCLPNYEDGALNGYLKYSCSDGRGVLVELFSDSGCTTWSDDSSYGYVYAPHGLCATVHRQSTVQGDASNWTTSAVAQCIEQAHTRHTLLPVPFAAGGAEFVVVKDFAAPTCDDPLALTDFYATRNNYCHRVFAGGRRFRSYLVLFPAVYVFQGYRCEPETLMGTVKYPPLCSAAEPDIFYDFAQGGVVSTSVLLYKL